MIGKVIVEQDCGRCDGTGLGGGIRDPLAWLFGPTDCPACDGTGKEYVTTVGSDRCTTYSLEAVIHLDVPA